jgi:3-isopropylmalate/(R)-2-methylmalate dehydratase small subunit
MEPFTRLSGIVIPLPRVNVDTDQIIPAQFMKRIERTGYGQFLFNSWRYLPDGSPNEGFVLNLPGYEGASILVSGRNFGSGSSREHAVWALHDYGIRCVITPTFADIFYNNCIQNGVLPVVLPEERVQQLIEEAERKPGYRLTVNLENQTIYDSEGFEDAFEIDPFIRERLLRGLDEIAMTLQEEDEIAAFERKRPSWLEPAKISP